MNFSDKDFEHIFTKRGISRDVMEGAFFKYTSVEEALNAWTAAGGKLTRGRTTVVKRRGARAPGMVMRRFPVPGADPDITPEMRPDWSIFTQPHPQRHQIVHRHSRLSPAARAAHIRSDHDSAEDVRKGCTPDEYEAIRSMLQPWEWEVNRGADHCGVSIPLDLDHAHIKIAKYLFSASPRRQVEVARHTHAEAFPGLDQTWDGSPALIKQLQKYNWHIRAHHTERVPGIDPETGEAGTSWERVENEPALDEEHGHIADVPDESAHVAKRLSWHPYEREARWRSGEVFFALEGCLKEAALATAGVATFSCPSVTLWGAPELEAFARSHLMGKTVYVVCDSDWGSNDLVTHQTLMARDQLRVWGIDAHAAAPPAPSGEKIGVDDHLGSGGQLDDLIVWDRRAPANLDHEVRARSTRRFRIDGHRNRMKVSRFVIEHAAPDSGGSKVILRTAAKHLGLSESAMKDAIKQTVADGILMEWEPLSDRVWSTSLGPRSDYTGLLGVPEELRAKTIQVRLGDLRKSDH